MKILVTGGTGFIGQSVVNKLLTRHDIRILARNALRTCEIFPTPTLKTIEGDVRDESSLRKAMEGVETVINCVQFPNHPVENRRKGYTYWQIDALGTERQVNVARTQGVRHFIYLSGAGTASDRKESWFVAKWYAEEAIRKSGVPFTILRPSWVYGPKDRSLNRFASLAKFMPIITILGDGKNRVQPIFVEDLAGLISEITSGSGPATSNPLGQTFDVGGPEEMTFRDVIETLLKVMGKKRRIVCIAKNLAKFGVQAVAFLSSPPITPEAIDFVTMDVRIETASLRRIFPHFKPRSLEEGLRGYL